MQSAAYRSLGMPPNHFVAPRVLLLFDIFSQRHDRSSMLATGIGAETPFVARVLRRTVEATFQSPCRNSG
jgi:hypothetical protein